MASDRQRTGTSAGVRVTRRRPVPILLPGLAVLGLLGWFAWRFEPGAPSVPPAKVPHEAAAPTVAAVPQDAAAEPPGTSGAADDDPRHAERVERARQRREERRDDRRSRAALPYTLNAPGEQAGLAAFPPPGSKPIKRGIVVPDDVELPEGYVRHYQTTDDGRQLPPILMYHPDFAGVDANGNPITPPADRVVPPELAPPGLPHRVLDETADAGEPVGRRSHGNAPYTTMRDLR